MLDRLKRTDISSIAQTLIDSLSSEVKSRGFSRLILGVSGGIDSAVSLFLAVKAVGQQNVVALSMPYKSSNPQGLDDAKMLIKCAGVEFSIIDITPQIDAYFSLQPDADLLRRGNKMARERMSILYDMSAKYQALVLGTSNKTEILLGYGTQFGDTASAINPLGELYKRDVRGLAAYLGVPDSIISKQPSADLWEGQTDEGEIGWSYEEIDHALCYMHEHGYSDSQLQSLRIAPELIKELHKRIKANRFKQVMPYIIPL